MSKPSLTGREQQQSSPSGLGQKQAKKQKNTAQTRRICTIFFPRDESYRASFEMPCCSFGGRKHA